MSDTSFLNILRGNREKQYLGLKMEEGVAHSFASDYTYIQVPVLGFFLDADEKLVDKVLRNQYVQVLPACTIDVKGTYKILVEPNPEIAKYGLFQASYYVHPGSGEIRPSFYFQARKDLNADELKYAIRLYMRA